MKSYLTRREEGRSYIWKGSDLLLSRSNINLSKLRQFNKAAKRARYAGDHADVSKKAKKDEL
jgi:hypothetical protein